MNEKRDYYEILGISREADESAIKKAYRKLVKKYHPDQNVGNAEAEKIFKEVTEAYTILSDPEKKKMYDQFGHAAFEQGEGTPYEGGDADDIFGDIFENLFGGRTYRGHNFKKNNFHRRGSDLQVEVSISFEEAAFGCSKIINLQNMNDVYGKGNSIQVKIPAGIDTGQSVRLRGKGAAGMGGMEPGDLLLKVKVGDKPGYERKGMDVYTTACVPYTTAVFGGEVMVETLYGKVLCKLRQGTQSGSKVRLRGKGIVSMKNPNVRGDQYVNIQIQVPQNLSREAEQKLREYEAACRQNKYKRTYS